MSARSISARLKTLLVMSSDTSLSSEAKDVTAPAAVHTHTLI
jgi:hypothetical protein